jgi:hypothetical protein
MMAGTTDRVALRFFPYFTANIRNKTATAAQFAETVRFTTARTERR